jgi:hypothetical protein
MKRYLDRHPGALDHVDEIKAARTRNSRGDAWPAQALDAALKAAKKPR